MEQNEVRDPPISTSPFIVAQLTALLKRPQGATLDELIRQSGWTASTLACVLDATQRHGHGLVESTREGQACYRLVEKL